MERREADPEAMRKAEEAFKFQTERDEEATKRLANGMLGGVEPSKKKGKKVSRKEQVLEQKLVVEQLKAKAGKPNKHEQYQ